MADSQKEFEMNGNASADQPISLEEIKAILFKILPKETAREILKVLPMYPSSTEKKNKCK